MSAEQQTGPGPADDEELAAAAEELAAYLDEVVAAVAPLCTPERVRARLAEVMARVRARREGPLA